MLIPIRLHMCTGDDQNLSIVETMETQCSGEGILGEKSSEVCSDPSLVNGRCEDNILAFLSEVRSSDSGVLWNWDTYLAAEDDASIVCKDARLLASGNGNRPPVFSIGPKQADKRPLTHTEPLKQNGEKT